MILTASGPVAAESAEGEPPTKDAPEKIRNEEGQLQGWVRSNVSNEAMVGVTVVAVRIGALAGDEAVAISDERGRYDLTLVPGTYTLTLYYLDVTVEHRDLVIGPGTSIFVPTVMEETSPKDFGCPLWDYHGVEIASMPRFGLATTRSFLPVSRDRTHRAWIAPAAAANPNTAVTTIENGARLHGAPGIPIAFVEEVSTSTLRVPIDHAAGAGGATNVALRGGTNETNGDVRLVLGLDRAHGASGGVETFVGGPLKRDTAWLAAGLVATRRPDDQLEAHGMAKLNYARTSEHQGELAALAQGVGTDTRDGWAQARWVSKFDDGKLELNARATAEHLALPAMTVARATVGPDPAGNVINRAGGQVDAKWRRKVAGHHQFAFTARGGGGLRGTTRHDDASIGIGDEWQLRPDLELQVGVRAEARRFGDAHARVLAPRLSVGYDFTEEGRSDVFIAYQRVPRLDDGLPGDWQTKPQHHDELAIGASYTPTVGKQALMFGVGGRARWAADPEAKLGLETWVRYDRRTTVLHASATTLDNVGTLVAQRRIVDRKADDVYAGVGFRVAPDRTEGGGSLVWKHTGARDRTRSHAIGSELRSLGRGLRRYHGAGRPHAARRLVVTHGRAIPLCRTSIHPSPHGPGGSKRRPMPRLERQSTRQHRPRTASAWLAVHSRRRRWMRRFFVTARGRLSTWCVDGLHLGYGPRDVAELTVVASTWRARRRRDRGNDRVPGSE